MKDLVGTFVKPEKNKRILAIEQRREKVLAVIQYNNEILANDVIRITGLKKDVVRQAIDKLVAMGKVEKIELGGYKFSYRAIK